MSDTLQRITDYLSGGGLFNPELANHDAVRDLLITCRDELSRLRGLIGEAVPQIMALSEQIACAYVGTAEWSALQTRRESLLARMREAIGRSPESSASSSQTR